MLEDFPLTTGYRHSLTGSHTFQLDTLRGYKTYTNVGAAMGVPRWNERRDNPH